MSRNCNNRNDVLGVGTCAPPGFACRLNVEDVECRFIDPDACCKCFCCKIPRNFSVEAANEFRRD
ncbi:MAG: hypothetical protein BWY15_01308 [Firmicutes bacterium ADurb.Bin193]|nr:MAG: hypothetical protein BWY15_01308 [Firmicutes bacterium ADurb.Bin193]